MGFELNDPLWQPEAALAGDPAQPAGIAQARHLDDERAPSLEQVLLDLDGLCQGVAQAEDLESQRRQREGGEQGAGDPADDEQSAPTVPSSPSGARQTPPIPARKIWA